MFREETDDRVVTTHAVLELQHVMPFVLEYEVVDVVSQLTEILDELAGLGLDDARVVLALDDEQRARDVLDIRLRRTFDEEVVIANRIAERQREVRLPGLRN